MTGSLSSPSVLPDNNVVSLSGNAASYQSGGKRHGKSTNKKFVKNNRRTYKGKKRSNSNSKKCWWKFW